MTEKEDKKMKSELYKDRDWLYQKLVVEGLTHKQASKEGECSESAITKWASILSVTNPVKIGISLKETRPDLVELWDFEKNNIEKIFPEDLTHTSSLEVYWLCKNNRAHSFKESPRNIGRRKEKCSICLGKIVTSENNVGAMYPHLKQEWDEEFNDRKITDITTHKNTKKKFGWICKNDHKYIRALESVISGKGCEYCKSIEFLRPDMLDEWIYEKNSKSPSEITLGSRYKAWWRCRDCNYEFSAAVYNKAKKRNYCPSCGGKVLWPELTLSHKNPGIEFEWDYEKNPDTPNDVFANSSEYRWWICPKGHSYKAIISNKYQGRGCPECDKGRKTSYGEQAIYYYIKEMFPDAVNRYRFEDEGIWFEYDIYIPSLNLAIEYDGVWFHQREEIVKKDSNKNKLSMKNNTALIRVREKGLDKMENSLCVLGLDPHLKNLNCIIEDVIEMVFKLFPNLPEELKSNTKPNHESVRRFIQSELSLKEMENSLKRMYPHIADDWNYEKNMELLPEHVPCKSNKIVWWICEKGHEWENSIVNRTQKGGKGRCPYCIGRIITKERSLGALCPEVAKFWHPVKNREKTPFDVFRYDNSTVWWLKNDKEYQRTVKQEYSQWLAKENRRKTNNKNGE